MAEETTTEPVVSEPVAEPAPVQPEPEIITSPAPEPTAEPVAVEETPTAQPVEPLSPEPALTPEPVEQVQESTPVPEPASEPVSNPEPQPIPAPVPEPPSSAEDYGRVEQVIASAFPISRARELLIKAREMIQFRKRKKLEKVMGMFLKKQSITNDDVQKLVYVSDATATRYLDQLEREGRIKKENAGKYLSYSRI